MPGGRGRVTDTECPHPPPEVGPSRCGGTAQDRAEVADRSPPSRGCGLVEGRGAVGRALVDARGVLQGLPINSVPPGVPGELYLAGPGLARGYHDRPALTAARFLADLHGPPGERMYRTGDLVTVSGDRSLRFHGRADDQVKIRGYRIELREIDVVLLSHPEVTFAKTVVHRDDGGHPRLASYVTTQQSVTAAELTAVVRAALPNYMVPAAVTVLDQVPTTGSGKLDRKALPEPIFSSATRSRLPQSEPELRLAAVFCDVLGCVDIGVEDSFFDLGGNSLLATRLAAGVTDEFGTELEVRAIFDAPTVAELVELIATTPMPDRAPLVATERPDWIPLSLAQQRIWFLNRLEPESSSYNIAAMVRIRGELDVSALRAAIADVIERHESLRTVFPDSDDGPRQQILSAAQATPWLPVTAVIPAEMGGRLHELATRAFDLTVDLPLRMELFRIDGREHTLAVVLHHIAADGWSLTPLTSDLARAYAARHAGTELNWHPLPVQYADFALWQRAVLGDESVDGTRAARQLEFWRGQLAGLPEELPLPYTAPRPPSPTFRAAARDIDVASDVVGRLRGVARRNDASLFMVLHAALAVLLRHISGARHRDRHPGRRSSRHQTR